VPCTARPHPSREIQHRTPPAGQQKVIEIVNIDQGETVSKRSFAGSLSQAVDGPGTNYARRRLIGAAAAGGLAFPLAAQGQSRRSAASGSGKEGPPQPASEQERIALEVLDDIDRRQRYLNVGREDGRLLRVLTEAIGAQQVIELGTSTGYSGIWLALALRGTGGKLTTYEINPERAAAARENFKRAGLQDLVTVILGDAHVEVRKITQTVDLVFIDADKEGYPDYLQQLEPRVRAGGLIVADNMRVPEPDPRYVQAVTTDPKLDTVFLNMHASGIGVTLKKHRLG
jgi:caffeoyl-CoA O-methyltransferase